MGSDDITVTDIIRPCGAHDIIGAQGAHDATLVLAPSSLPLPILIHPCRLLGVLRLVAYATGLVTHKYTFYMRWWCSAGLCFM
eukprot:5794538-Ditylum_brightwellii.AAC.1